MRQGLYGPAGHAQAEEENRRSSWKTVLAVSKSKNPFGFDHALLFAKRGRNFCMTIQNATCSFGIVGCLSLLLN